jgi:hypothetical protein
MVQIHYRPLITADGMVLPSAVFFGEGRMKQLWSPLALSDPGESTFSIGDLEGRVVLRDGCYRLHLDGKVVGETGPIPAGWRELHVAPSATLAFEPATPDLPIVLKPQEAVAVAPDQTVRYLVRLPLWVRLIANTPYEGRRGERQDVFLDAPTRELKRTWFGTSESGDVGYGWSFLPRVAAPPQRNLFTVPLTIINTSPSVLWFDRLLLRVVHLDLYRFGDHVESNGVTVAFKGVDHFSQITFEESHAITSRGGTLLSSRRVYAGQDIVRRSFLWLRELTS